MSAQNSLEVPLDEKVESINVNATGKGPEDVEQHELIRVLSLAPSETLPSTIPPAPVKDGGLRAWLQVLGCFILYFNLWGYIFSFGAFQNYYVTDRLRGTSASAIAWIGGIQSFLLILSGVFAGPLFDLGYFNVMIFGGAILSTIGAMMLSVSTKYWQVFLTQGVCAGLGSGVMFVPSMALVARSFFKHRSLAVGIMTSGAPFGSIMYTFVFQGLLHRVGFAWTARAMAFLMIIIYIVSLPLIMWRSTNTGNISAGIKRKLIDKAAFSDVPFWAYTASTFCLFLAYLTPYIFMPTYAYTKLGTSQSFASYVLAISQGASIPGRVLAAIAANQVGVMIPWTVCSLVSAMMCLMWITANTVPRFVIFCAFYGFFSGALIPLPPSVFPVVCPDRAVLGTRLGMAQAFTSIANLIGPPIGGALLNAKFHDGQNWIALQLWCSVVLLLGLACLSILWALLVKTRNAKLLT